MVGGVDTVSLVLSSSGTGGSQQVGRPAAEAKVNGEVEVYVEVEVGVARSGLEHEVPRA